MRMPNPVSARTDHHGALTAQSEIRAGAIAVWVRVEGRETWRSAPLEAPPNGTLDLGRIALPLKQQ